MGVEVRSKRGEAGRQTGVEGQVGDSAERRGGGQGSSQ